MNFFAIHADAKPPASAFGELPNVYDAAISPDGSKIAAFAAIDDGYGIAVYYIDGSDRQPFVAGMGDRIKPSWIKWANDDIVLASIWRSQNYSGTPISSSFIYSLDVNKQDGKILIDPNKARRIGTTKKGIFRQFNNRVVDFLSDDPDHILMSFSDTNTFAPDVQKVNVKSGRYEIVRRGSENTQSWYTDLRGEVRIAQGMKDSSKEKWVMRIRDTHDEKWRSSDEYPGLNADEDIFGFTGNPSEVVIGRYNGKDTRSVFSGNGV